MTVAPALNSRLRTVAAAGRHRLLPALLLTAAMALVLALNLDRAHFYAPFDNDTAIKTAIAENLSPEHNFRMFTRLTYTEEGELTYDMYSRFPIGGFALIKLVILPFGDNLATKVFAARMLMLAFLTAAAFLAYYAIARIASNRWIALTAVLAAFSSYYVLRYSNVVSTDFMMGLFAVMLTFHGMVIFVQEGRFRQLVVKTCIALFIAWHVYGLLLPFVALGLGGELISAIKARRSPGDSARQLFSTIRRSRYLRLGLAALLFGVAMLAFNVLSEYDAFNGETPLGKLPSVESALIKPGLLSVGSEDGFPWAQFSMQQFYRIAGASFPYALTQIEGHLAETTIGAVPMALGAAMLGGCLIATLFARRFRIPLAALAMSGFCWALLIRTHVLHTFHHHEAIYYIGVPLTLVTILLTAARFRGVRLLLGAATVASLAGFGISAQQMVAADHDRLVEARSRMRVFAEFAAIREIAEGKYVFVNQSNASAQRMYGNSRALSFLLAGSPFRYREEGAGQDGDLVLMTHRDDEFPLLTPDNAAVFLYGPSANPGDLDRALFNSIASDAYGQPAARALFNVHVDREERMLIYTREPCAPADIEQKFFLHIFPERRDALPEWRRQYGYDNLDFAFPLWGLSLDGVCIAQVPLPDYAISSVRTGQFGDRGRLWEARFSFNADSSRPAREAVASREPDARGRFNVHVDREERALVYTREPCVPTDADALFFLHIAPERASDLPRDRESWGFDAWSFDFYAYGLLFEGKCAAKVPLQAAYPVSGVRTGQWTPDDGELWEAVFPFNPDAYRAVYESAASREPDASGMFNVHIDREERALIYTREPCALSDVEPRFFLHVMPERASDLPEERKELGVGFDALDFDFRLRGAVFDGKCAARVPLPDYPIRSIRTGQWTPNDGESWDAAFPFDLEAHRAAYESAASREPDVRAAFDLYLSEDARALTYLKEPCAPPDLEPRFFLHVTPERASDLPEERRDLGVGFDALDFDFRLRGAAFDGKCAAKVSLPAYPIKSIRTGQWIPGEGEVWKASLPFPADG